MQKISDPKRRLESHYSGSPTSMAHQRRSDQKFNFLSCNSFLHDVHPLRSRRLEAIKLFFAVRLTLTPVIAPLPDPEP